MELLQDVISWEELAVSVGKVSKEDLQSFVLFEDAHCSSRLRQDARKIQADGLFLGDVSAFVFAHDAYPVDL